MTELHTITSYVRGGGVVGSRAWVAKITGPDAKFGLSREFVRKVNNCSGSGRSGSLNFVLVEPGYYEFRGVGSNEASIASQSRNGGGVSGFIRLDADGSVTAVERSEVIAAMQTRG